ncbi:MAG: hypothetical protein QMC36_01455 [Patescibacteria group bacterium]
MEFLIREALFFPFVQALHFLHPLLEHFVPPGLYGEIRLCERHFRFSRISVLGDEVASVPGEHDVRNDHIDFSILVDGFLGFPDVGKTLFNRISSRETRILRFGNNQFKIAPFGISKNSLQFLGIPEFYSGFARVFDVLERLEELQLYGWFHKLRLTVF